MSDYREVAIADLRPGDNICLVINGRVASDGKTVLWDVADSPLPEWVRINRLPSNVVIEREVKP